MAMLSGIWERRPVRVAAWSTAGVVAVAATAFFALPRLRGAGAGHAAGAGPGPVEVAKTKPTRGEPGVIRLTAAQ